MGGDWADTIGSRTGPVRDGADWGMFMGLQSTLEGGVQARGGAGPISCWAR